MTQSKKLAIVVLNWNDYKSTKKCLDSIFKACKESLKLTVKACTIYVVDNNSLDGSQYVLKKYIGKKNSYIDQDLIYIQSNNNLGYSGGNNIALKHAYSLDFDFYLVVNNDAVLEKNLIDGLLESLSKGADIVGPSIIDPETMEVQSAGKRLDVFFGRHSAYKDIDVGLRDVGYVSGACIMFNKKVLDKVSFLNEDYFMYTEDVEFCLRAKYQRLKVCCNTDVYLFHSSKGSIGSKQSAGIRKYYQTRNNILMAVKHFEKSHIAFYTLFVFFRVLKNSLFFLVKGNYFSIYMSFCGFIDGVKLNKGKLGKY